MKQILLNAKECSGRGVRVRLLGVDGRLKVSENAAAEIGKEGTMMQLRAREAIESVCAFENAKQSLMVLARYAKENS